MHNLQAMQSAIRDVVLGGDAQALEGEIANDGIPYSRRLQVYRNNTTVLLSEALAANFPIVCQLVGEAFFAKTAYSFVRLHPPRSPCLFEYGAGLADFLDNYLSVHDLPYLADMARLEWAWDEAFHSRESAAMSADGFAAVATANMEKLTFEPHPAFRVVRSSYPLDRIWALHQDEPEPDETSEETIDLESGGACLAVVRPGAEVRVITISPGAYVMAEALMGSACLGDALMAADTAEPGFNAATALATLVNAGAFSRASVS